MESSADDSEPRALGLAALVLILTLAHWGILVGRVPVFTSLQWWFWDFSEQPLDAAWLVFPLAALGALAVWIAMHPRIPLGRAVAALIALGFLWQQGLGLLEGRGIDGIRDHIVWTGHAQFASAAARQESVAAVIRDYEELAPRGDHGKYAKSKPPGTLLLYVFTDRVAGWFSSREEGFARLDWLQTFASYTWPFLCYLVLIPMASFARRWLHPEAGPLAVGLYLFVPSVSLMTLHTDQTFYPLLAVVFVLLAGLSGEKGSSWLALASGAWLYLCLFCSFGLVAVVPLGGAMAILAARQSGAGGLAPARLARLAALTAAGWIACDLLLRFGFDYDIAARYRSAIAHHLAWKFGWEWSVSNVATIAGLDALETVVWLGVPLALVAGAACLRALRRIATDGWAPASGFASALLLVFLALLFLSRTKGEAGRLWLFLAPFACLVAGEALARTPAAGRRGWVPAFFALQGGTVLLTKAFQDF